MTLQSCSFSRSWKVGLAPPGRPERASQSTSENTHTSFRKTERDPWDSGLYIMNVGRGFGGQTEVKILVFEVTSLKVRVDFTEKA